jgi:hypothetical protein
MRRAAQFLWFTVAAVAVAPAVRADRVDDLARIHVEALGGRERIAALAAMRASGEVDTGGKRVRFTLTAARPDRVRLETAGGGSRTLVQATDGREPPWEFDTGSWPPRYQTMPENVARAFAADAEFDDPLVAGRARGFEFEYAGDAQIEGHAYLRVLVKRNPGQSFAILIDADTYMIAMRTEKRQGAGGKATQIVTRYEDYRPVDGVLLPHRITVTVDGRVLQQTVIEAIIANPELTVETFTRPKSAIDAAPRK